MVVTRGSLAPLVEIGPPLTPEEVRRFSWRLLLPLVGEAGQRRLRNPRVCVVGAGGLGTPVLLYLAAAGVGRLGIIDDDHVDMSNLQRQVIHIAADVGASRSTARSTASTGLTRPRRRGASCAPEHRER
jgi:molybdopterin/thiamine biosynthesis adenylyltransferase